jgi:hypothetical protein
MLIVEKKRKKKKRPMLGQHGAEILIKQGDE